MDGANSFLARVVYLVRWFSKLDTDLGRTQFKIHLDFMNEIKTAISNELRTAEEQGQITCHPSLKLMLDKLVTPYSRSFMLVTTNWDSVISKSIQQIMDIDPDFELHLYPLHIHGRIGDASTLYLPSEVTRETYRTLAEEQAIGTIHGTVWQGLEQASRVIIYGLSIDPLDAELGQTLAAGWGNPNLKEIFIIDFRNELVAHRVNLLLDRRRDVRVIGLNPETLVEEADYTIWRHNKPK